MTNHLTRFDADRALTEATTIGEIKTLIDKASATEDFAYSAKDFELFRRAVRFHMEAARKAGHELIRMAEAGERSRGRTKKDSSQTNLSELRISGDQSSYWQKLAKWDDNNFEAEVEKREDRIVKFAQREERDKDAPKPPRIVPPSDRYETIVIDPPWPIQMIETDHRLNQKTFPYPVMQESELRDFGTIIESIAAENCHLFMWTTQKMKPLAMELVDHYGFRYVLTMVWHKPNGVQPIGLPKYNAEFILYARKGAPRFIDTKDFWCCFSAPMREHSRKPDEFYETIRRVTDGKRIDVFSREFRDGFDQFGNESDKFSESA